MYLYTIIPVCYRAATELLWLPRPHLVQVIGALNELWPERVVTPIGLEVMGERLREEVVSLHHMIEHVVDVNGCVHITIQHLGAVGRA